VEEATRDLLLAFSFVATDDDIVEGAMNEPDRGLRSLDVIHLATARVLGEDLDAIVSYDDRLLKAATDAGLPTASGRFAAPSAPSALGHDRQSLFEMAPGLFEISPSDACCHGSGDDHISRFGEEVIAAAADSLARVQAVDADERFRGLAGLLGQLQQLYLDGDFPMAGVQVTDLIPHSLPVSG
jgi:hypothetical protein